MVVLLRYFSEDFCYILEYSSFNISSINMTNRIQPTYSGVGWPDLGLKMTLTFDLEPCGWPWILFVKLEPYGYFDDVKPKVKVIPLALASPRNKLEVKVKILNPMHLSAKIKVYLNSQNKCINCLWYHFLQFSFTVIFLKILLKTFFHYIYILLLLVFSPWAGLGRDQSSVRRLVWLWYAASWASS